ncbi:hypothetical protein C8F04DRAFT_1276304 [Mycena alexandri]|uniref:Ribonuclease H1 N-terminal domain-containing protein n=1 Tax=Mycena alexandri TaxID=1745969 RepID=A0AAD6S3S3_9AGAR|nr:hypothetical protein C8F04DRAFT_1276304 [Mycena alexandri]
MAQLQLPKTNMTAQELVPDINTPGHDTRYWCLPPVREDADDVVPIGGGYEYHLVSQGRQVRVWKNWTVAQKMITGFPNSAHKGHHTLAPDELVCYARQHSSREQRDWDQHQHQPQPKLSADHRTDTAPTEIIVDAVEAKYFAIFGAGMVYSSRAAAKAAFDDAVDDGDEPELLTTDDWDVAVAFAEGNC